MVDEPSLFMNASLEAILGTCVARVGTVLEKESICVVIDSASDSGGCSVS